MLFTRITLVVVALAAAPAVAIPPPIFGFPDSDNHTELGVTFTHNDNSTLVQEAMLFGSNITQSQPQLSLDPAMYESVANYSGQYVVVMVDPDASTPEDPSKRFILHWLAANVSQTPTTGTSGRRQLSPPSSSSNNTIGAGGNGNGNGTTASGNKDLVAYRAPTPGTTSSAHRYIVYAFQQPAVGGGFSLPAAFAGLAASDNPDRAGFNLTAFVAAAGLGRPAAAEYFYVSRRAEVPGEFVAAAGGEYPGGNGGAIFENSPNAAGNSSSSSSSNNDTSSSAGRRAGGWVDMVSGLGIWLVAVLM